MRHIPRCLFAATAVFVATLSPAHAQPATWDATTVEGEALLRVPRGLAERSPTAFDVAETPPRVEVVVASGLPEKEGDALWTSWGDGCLASDGLYYTSIGDHMGRDATSYLLAYDPAQGRLRRLVDVADAIDQEPGQYGHGKIHAGIHEASDGWLYFATYWGKHRQIPEAFGEDYRGSILMRYHPSEHRVENLGEIVPRQGLPGSYFDRQRGLIYFYAVYENNLAVYEIGARERVFLGGADQIAGRRAFLPGPDGRVFMSGQDGRLRYYDPAKQRLSRLGVGLGALPGTKKERRSTLRAAAERPDDDGWVYGMTAGGRLFRLDPAAEKLQDLGPNFADGMYTAAMVMGPRRRYLYYLPGAHGGAVSAGTPVVQYNLASGRRRVLAFLNGPVRRRLSYNIAGSYNLCIGSEGRRLFATFNGAPYQAGAKEHDAFGQPSMAVIHIPASSR